MLFCTACTKAKVYGVHEKNQRRFSSLHLVVLAPHARLNAYCVAAAKVRRRRMQSASCCVAIQTFFFIRWWNNKLCNPIIHLCCRSVYISSSKRYIAAPVKSLCAVEIYMAWSERQHSHTACFLVLSRRPSLLFEDEAKLQFTIAFQKQANAGGRLCSGCSVRFKCKLWPENGFRCRRDMYRC